MPKIIPPGHILHIISRLEARGFEAWCVGGCVRDALLGREPSDWDVATSALPEEILGCFPELKAIETGRAHGTITLVTPQGLVEATTYRIDGEYTGHRRPAGVSFSQDITQDLSRRDFTVNAMAWHPDRGLLDPFGGQSDLAAHILRCVGDPARRFDEDALRILRGVRFAAALGFEIETDSLAAALDCMELLGSLSGERTRSELTRLLCAPGAQPVLERYASIILAALPELTSLPSLGDVPPDPILRWAALLRDCGPDTAKGLLTRLRFPNREISRITWLVKQLPMVPEDLSLAHRLRRAGLTLSKLAVSGADLMALGYSPGPGLGEALDSLLRAVLSGELPNRREELLAHVQKNNHNHP